MTTAQMHFLLLAESFEGLARKSRFLGRGAAIVPSVHARTERAALADCWLLMFVSLSAACTWTPSAWLRFHQFSNGVRPVLLRIDPDIIVYPISESFVP